MDKKGLGKLSDNALQNFKYHFVITTAIVARYCIKGGMELPKAYSISDFYIQKADRMKRIEDVKKFCSTPWNKQKKIERK